MPPALVVVALTAALFLSTPSPPFEVSFPQDPWTTSFDDSFGYPRVGHRHKGNDLMAPKGTRVFAAAAGTVERIGTGRTAGRYIKIDHGDGWSSYYMHLNNDRAHRDDGRADWIETVTVAEGDQVAAGAHIGFVGDSGNAEATPPHTHFELRYQGRAIDPYEILELAQIQAIASEIEVLVQSYVGPVSENPLADLELGT